MGQKVDPRGLRIGIIKTWNSKWFAQGNDYLNNFHEDLKIKEYIKKNYYHAGISRIFIERNSLTELTVIIETAKAGILIGRKGQEIEALKAKLEKLTGKKVNTKALEIKNPNKDAQLVAESIATSIEKRVAYKRAVQQAMQRAEKSGVKGIKVKVSGRLNGAEIARSEWTLSGRVPLHTLRADIDYATATANTTYGALGIKVWIFNGEVLPTTKEGGNE
ncbi:30S ribosomal protein S3 [Sneathia vaginalis]|uniref:Small ribosomal subunit protein uS3 n=1 Tax=Sneathia vaginalis TaxID=187101 RepID=A0A0E3UU93_9FUSO|nr:30S ribosomal protein S3 [Sneathia vaginalis]AKC95083.1 30S ribosomal protein S3 [Sneathia vaginalis]